MPSTPLWVYCATAAVACICLLYYTSASGEDQTWGEACKPFTSTLATRHGRRHRRHELLPLLQDVPKQIKAQLDGGATFVSHAAWRAQIAEARCLLKRSADGDLLIATEIAARAAEPLLQLDEAARRSGNTGSTTPGRRLGRWREAVMAANKAVAASSTTPGGVGATSATRRITRGLGVFAGADFPCDADRDAFIGAPWSRGACLLKCSPGSMATAPRCSNAIAVCERRAECATVDINVEGSIATLKAETELSARTSRVKQVAVTHARGIKAVGTDGPCAPDARVKPLALRALSGRTACVLDCPALNCTRGVELCFAAKTCVGVEISFQVESHSAVARLRYAS